jgi:hypothetical protein
MYTIDNEKRFVDGFNSASRAIYECKTGIVTLNSRVRNQIAKDAALMAQGEASEAIWVFQKGTKVSKGVMKALMDAKITSFSPR